METSDSSAATANRSLPVNDFYPYIRGSIFNKGLVRTASGLSFFVHFEVATTCRRSYCNHAQVIGRYAATRVAFNRAFRRFGRITLSAWRSGFHFQVARTTVVFSRREFTLRVSRAGRSRALVISVFHFRPFSHQASGALIRLLRGHLVNGEGQEGNSRSAYVRAYVTFTSALVIFYRQGRLMTLTVHRRGRKAFSAIRRLFSRSHLTNVTRRAPRRVIRLLLYFFRHIRGRRAFANDRAINLRCMKDLRFFRRDMSFFWVSNEGALVANYQGIITRRRNLHGILTTFRLHSLFQESCRKGAYRNSVILRVVVRPFRRQVFQACRRRASVVYRNGFLSDERVIDLSVCVHTCRYDAYVAKDSGWLVRFQALDGLPNCYVFTTT